MTTIKTRLLIFLIILAGLIGLHRSAAQGTAFTYQGRLQDGAQPANGSYDFIFLIYSDTNTTVPLVSGYPVSGVPLSNGLFTATIDFGPDVFTGAERWLEISVRTNGAAGYTVVAPRQKLTPAPYAILAGSVSSGGLAAGTYANALTLNNPANQFAGDGSGLSNLNAVSLDGLTGSSFWQLGGNNVAAGQFLGSTNNQPLEFQVDGQRALRLEYIPYASPPEPNVIGGSPCNWVAIGAGGATIAGGGARSYIQVGVGYTNVVTASFGTVGGGLGNLVGGLYGVIGGGFGNEVDAASDVIGGGSGNTIIGFNTLSTIGGGDDNAVQSLSHYSTIGGGATNLIASGAYGSSVGGGAHNTIQSNAYWSTIAGGNGNTIQTNAQDATIGGGIGNTIRTNAQYAAIAGGNGNTIGFFAYSAAISGGSSNLIQAAADSVIAGGNGNTIQDLANYSSILGGNSNLIQASAGYGVIGGGLFNTNLGLLAVVPGGDQNVAATYGLAAGHRAKALQQGVFVWADSQDADFASTAVNQFLVRAQGGVGINTTNPEAPLHVAPAATGGGIVLGVDAFSGGYTALQIDVSSISNGYAKLQAINKSGTAFGNLVINGAGGNVGIGKANPATALDVNGTVTATAFNPPSDRNLKENFTAISPREVLDKVTALSISRWNFKGDSATPHLGPMAQDFYAAFGLGTDNRHIATVDADGVALAAIQGLNQKFEAELESKEKRISALEGQLAELKLLVQTLSGRQN